jgi:hypothetical protein
MPVLELTLLLRAFAAVEMRLRSEVLVVFDARRYLPREQVDGNFVAGLLLPLSAGDSVQRIGAVLTDAAESGRPLTALAAGLVRNRIARPTVRSRLVGVPRLAFTHVGRPPAIERLPFLPTAPAMYAGSIDPGDPSGITVATTQTGGSLHLSATFYDQLIRADEVSGALDTLAADPVRLLDDRPVTRTFVLASRPGDSR